MPRPPRQWTPEEDDLIRTHGGGGKVARLLRAKSGAAAAPSARQVKDRWMSLQPDRAWSRKENALILRCLCTNDSPTISWERLALSLPHRLAYAVRAHWQATEALLRPQLVAAWDVPGDMITLLGKVRPRAGGAEQRGVVRRLDPQIFHVVARPAVLELMWDCGGGNNNNNNNNNTKTAAKRKRAKTAPPPSKRARRSSPAAVAPSRTATVTPHVARQATARALPTRRAKATTSPTVQPPSPTGSMERKKRSLRDFVCSSEEDEEDDDEEQDAAEHEVDAGPPSSDDGRAREEVELEHPSEETGLEEESDDGEDPGEADDEDHVLDEATDEEDVIEAEEEVEIGHPSEETSMEAKDVDDNDGDDDVDVEDPGEASDEDYVPDEALDATTTDEEDAREARVEVERGYPSEETSMDESDVYDSDGNDDDEDDDHRIEDPGESDDENYVPDAAVEANVNDEEDANAPPNVDDEDVIPVGDNVDTPLETGGPDLGRVRGMWAFFRACVAAATSLWSSNQTEAAVLPVEESGADKSPEEQEN